MKWDEFNATNSTGENESDMLFKSDVTSPKGARYQLLKESHHTIKDLDKAKRYLRNNFDVVSIDIIKETV